MKTKGEAFDWIKEQVAEIELNSAKHQDGSGLIKGRNLLMRR